MKLNIFKVKGSKLVIIIIGIAFLILTICAIILIYYLTKPNFFIDANEGNLDLTTFIVTFVAGFIAIVSGIIFIGFGTYFVATIFPYLTSKIDLVAFELIKIKESKEYNRKVGAFKTYHIYGKTKINDQVLEIPVIFFIISDKSVYQLEVNKHYKGYYSIKHPYQILLYWD